jgi:hypothetical protein
VHVSVKGKCTTVASAALALLAAVVAGCSSGTPPVGLSVSLMGNDRAVYVSRVSCVATNQRVAVVSGSFKANPGALSASEPTLLVKSFARVYDGGGHLIASFAAPGVKIASNRTEAFRFQVPLSGDNPASCRISWTTAPPIVAE